MKSVGKPCAGKSHARFDEEARDDCLIAISLRKNLLLAKVNQTFRNCKEDQSIWLYSTGSISLINLHCYVLLKALLFLQDFRKRPVSMYY